MVIRKNRLALYILVALIFSFAIYLMLRVFQSRSPPIESPKSRPVPNRASERSSINKLATPVAAAGNILAQKVSDELGSPSASQLHGCYLASKILVGQNNVADCASLRNVQDFENQYASCLNNLVDAKARIAAAESTVKKCGDKGTLVARYYHSTVEAAKNGDLDAQLCFLESNFYEPDGSFRYSDSDIAHYKKIAPVYVASGLERGDWRVVELLTTNRFGFSSGLLSYLDGIGTPETTYKMNRLLRLGATGSLAETINLFISDFKNPDGKTNSALSSDQMVAADAWAQDMYSRYFDDGQKLDHSPQICGTAAN